jgi:hypothetical protein
MLAQYWPILARYADTLSHYANAACFARLQGIMFVYFIRFLDFRCCFVALAAPLGFFCGSLSVLVFRCSVVSYISSFGYYSPPQLFLVGTRRSVLSICSSVGKCDQGCYQGVVRDVIRLWLIALKDHSVLLYWPCPAWPAGLLSLLDHGPPLMVWAGSCRSYLNRRGTADRGTGL